MASCLRTPGRAVPPLPGGVGGPGGGSSEPCLESHGALCGQAPRGRPRMVWPHGGLLRTLQGMNSPVGRRAPPRPRVGRRRAAVQVPGWSRPCLSLCTWQLPRATHRWCFPLKYALGMPKETLPTHKALHALRGDCGLAAPTAPSCGALGSWGRGKPLLSCRLSSLGQYPAGSHLGEHTQYQEQFAHTFSLAPTIQCGGFVITPTLPLCKLRLGKETAPAQGPTARWC